MTLDKGKRGQLVKILSIPNRQIRTQAIRFGLIEGTVVEVAEVVPSGPVVLKKNNQEIALGRRVAQDITIEVLSRDMNFDKDSKLTFNS